jgi:hypothetical protein
MLLADQSRIRRVNSLVPVPTRRNRSRVYPTMSGIRPLLLASGCIAWIRVRDGPLAKGKASREPWHNHRSSQSL